MVYLVGVGLMSAHSGQGLLQRAPVNLMPVNLVGLGATTLAVSVNESLYYSYGWEYIICKRPANSCHMYNVTNVRDGEMEVGVS